LWSVHRRRCFATFAAGTIDGFYAGEPWNSVAVREGTGWCPITARRSSPVISKKVLLVTQRFAESRPANTPRSVAALLEACTWCDEPQNREPLAEILAKPQYLNLPARVIALRRCSVA